MVGTLDQSYRSSPGFDMGSIDAGSHDDVLDENEEMGNFLPGYEDSTGKTLPLPTQRHVIVMCVIFLFIVEFSMFVMEPPLQAVMEDFVCHEIYPDHVMEASAAEQDSRCKDPSVQTVLAMARSWLMWTGMFVRKYHSLRASYSGGSTLIGALLLVQLCSCKFPTAWLPTNTVAGLYYSVDSSASSSPPYGI